MLERRYMIVGGKPLKITISDEDAVLLAARSAGGAAVGIIGEAGGCSIGSCSYAVTDISDIDREFLIYAARRSLGLPIFIAETERLIIRELVKEDMDSLQVLALSDTAEDRDNLGVCEYIFHDGDRLCAYIENQYRYYDYGIWGIFDRLDGHMVGKAGIVSIDGCEAELSYHIDAGFRRRGYAEEACRAVEGYAEKCFGIREFYVRLRKGNTASEELAKKLRACVKYL